MSVEAITWALNLAPVPWDKGKPNSACAFVLVGLANHADPDGTGAFPSVRTLARYTRLSERTVRTALDRLEEEDVIRPTDPELIAARIKRADRRPHGYDLDMSLVRTDLDEETITALERQFPGLRERVAAARAEGGVQRLHPVSETPDGVQPTHPVDGNGVQPPQERGAAVAPEPSLEPSLKTPPPAPSTAAGENLAAAGERRGDQAHEVISLLPPGLRPATQDTPGLLPELGPFLAGGWTPRALATELAGDPPPHVRNRAAFLRARLRNLDPRQPPKDTTPTPPPYVRAATPGMVRAADRSAASDAEVAAARALLTAAIAAGVTTSGGPRSSKG